MGNGGTILRIRIFERATLLILFVSVLTGVSPVWGKDIISAILDAADRDDQAKVEALLNEQPGVDVRDESGATLLMWACSRGAPAIVKMLLDRGVKVNATDRYGRTALIFAADQGRPDTVRLLLEQKADANAKESLSGTTALTRACFKGNVEVSKLLLDGGANVDSEDDDGETPLMWAVTEGHLPVVKLLLDRGADPDTSDKADLDSLIRACALGSTEIAELLLDAGADPKAEYPRHFKVYAALERLGAEKQTRHIRELPTVWALYAWATAHLSSADSDRNKNEKKSRRSPTFGLAGGACRETSLLEWACLANQPKVVKLLLDRGVNVNARRWRGQ